MSASLIWAVTWGDDRSVRVMKPPVVVPLLAVVDAAVVDDVELPPPLAPPLAPPLTHWPATPLMLATTPAAGAMSVAPSRLLRAIWSAARALSASAWAAATSDSRGGFTAFA